MLDLFNKRNLKKINGLSTVKEDASIITETVVYSEEEVSNSVDRAVAEYRRNVKETSSYKETISNCSSYIRNKIPYFSFSEEFLMYDTVTGAIGLCIDKIETCIFKIAGNRDVPYTKKYEKHSIAISSDSIDYSEDGTILLKRWEKEISKVLISLEKALNKKNYNKACVCDQALYDLERELVYINILRLHIYKKEGA